MPFIHDPNAFIPFSFGPSNCVGKYLALKEMKMALCHILQKVDVRFAEGYDPTTWDAEIADRATLQLGVLPVTVTVRNT